jgi:hypothetical protein
MNKHAVRLFSRLARCAALFALIAQGRAFASDLTMNIKSGQEVAFFVSGIEGSAFPSNFPPGIECDESGYVSGRTSYTNNSGRLQVYESQVYHDGNNIAITWNVTPIVQATANPSISPGAVQQVGQAITLTRDGSAANAVKWCETSVTRPDGSRVVTSHAGLGSNPYTLDGGQGYYSYTLKIGDSTGAALVSDPISFYGGQITPSAFSPANPQVGQIVSFAFTSNPGLSAGAITTNPALDQVVATTVSGASATAQVQPRARDNGQHWIWMSAYSGNWWGNGVFLPVSKATPIQQPPAIALAGSASGDRTLVAGDLSATITNPFDSSMQYSGLTAVEFRLAFSNVQLALGAQLSNGAHLVDADFLGNNDYNPATARGFVTVSGPIAPTNLEARVTGPSKVELRWSGWAAAPTQFAVYRDGAYLGSYTGGSSSLPFTDSAATPGAIVTYSVKAVDGAGAYSPPATITLNALEVFSPGI